LADGEWRELRAALEAGAEDAIVVVWAAAEDAATAAREVLIRAREALDGVPAETRQARRDGRTDFERLLPGPDRMYPDTDTPPLPLSDRVVAEVLEALPERPWEREARYEELGLAPASARRLARAPWAVLFDAVAPEPGDTARRLAHVLEERVPYHARRVGVDLEGREREAEVGDVGAVAAAGFGGWAALGLGAERLVPVVRAVESGEILPTALQAAVDDLAADPARPVPDTVARYRPRPDDPARLAGLVREVVTRAEVELPGRPFDVVVRWAMGEVMRALWGRVEAGEVRSRIVEALDCEEVEVTA
ncbi:MAG: hypothetical protein ACOCVZ_06390, partial [Gemmatimonadota bacterium]